MLFRSKENQCVLQVLQILNKKQSKYSDMFRATKVSHTTLQRVLRELLQKRFIKKHDIGHQNVDYEVTEKGKTLLRLLIDVNKISG